MYCATCGSPRDGMAYACAHCGVAFPLAHPPTPHPPTPFAPDPEPEFAGPSRGRAIAALVLNIVAWPGLGSLSAVAASGLRRASSC